MPTPSPYLRYPTIRGDRLAFVTDDDVWVASVERGDAWRLSADRVPVRAPRLSPDGTQVAWTSRAAGAAEAFAADLDGGPGRRLTWWGDATTSVLGWTPDGRVVVASAVGEPFAQRTWAWAVPASGGGGPERLPYGPLTALSFGEAGLVVGVDQSPSRGAAWKRYRGGTMAKAWIDPDGAGAFGPFAAELGGQVEDPQYHGGRVAFISDHEGWGNVYSLAPDGSDLRRHTDHGDAYARSLAGDGERLVYSCAGDLWLLDDLSPSSTPHRLDLRLASARAGNATRPLAAGDALRHVAPDAAGRGAALGIRGAVVWLAHRDGPARVLAPGGAARARIPAVLGDDRVVWVSDAAGDDDAVAVSPLAGDGAEPRLLGAGELGRVVDLAASPNGKWVATASHDGAIRLTDATSGATREVDRSRHDIAAGLAWSPDSAWLAWSHAGPVSGERGLYQIRLAPAAGGEVLEATPMRFHDVAPVFTPDGRYLAFLSSRIFDPVYDELRFDLSFPAATRPYLLRLAAAVPPPLGPSPDGRPVTDAPGSDRGRAAEDAAAPPEVTVGADGLQDRVVDLPVAAGRLEGLAATAGGLVWRRLPTVGELGDSRADPFGEPAKGALEHLDLRTGEVITLAEGVDAAAPTAAGAWLVVRKGPAIEVVPADRRPGDGETVAVDLDRIRLTVDPPAEWVQMYEEAGRLIRDLFWVADMAGVDWDAARARYRPLTGRVSTRDELTDLVWELHGELGTSHAYASPPEVPPAPDRRLGYLGADLVPDAGGSWAVGAVVASDASVPAARSPLGAAGVTAGEAVVAVNGRAVDGNLGPGPLLVGTAGRITELTVRAPGGSERRVAVRPLPDERPLRYHAWVAAERAEVHRASGGRAGYVHVPDMMVAGWAEFHRDLRLEVRRDALVVDLRNNRGGHTSQLVMERLADTVRAWQLAGPLEPFTYPDSVPRGPMVALVDQNAGSDGDIGSLSFRQLGLGPLVGTRTWGGVIGIDMRYDLVDGGAVTQPRYAFWFVDGAWGVENHGVDPDVVVPIPPQDWGAGRDPQLDTAVRMVLEALEGRTPLRPPDPATRPDRSAPALPPRP